MRLIVIDVEFASDPPTRSLLIGSLERSLSPAMELEHMFVLCSGPRTVACCFYVKSTGAFEDLVMLVRRALATLAEPGTWRILRVRESI